MTISVVIPTKNRARLLKLCLMSLVNQTIIPDEVIIIDNNSTDKSSLVINRFKKKLPIIYQVNINNNLPSLYNAGIKLANSKIIACLDDDCWVEKNWVENIISAYQSHPNSVIQGKIISYPQDNIYTKIMAQHYQNWLKTHLLANQTLAVLDTKSVVFPSQIIKKNLFIESFEKGSHDIELGTRLSNKHIKIILDENIVAWHKERTTLRGFIAQHWRIAQSEAVLKNDSKNSDIKIIFSRKNLLSLFDMAKLIIKEISKFNIQMVIYIPFLYFMLLMIRVGGFIYIKFQKNLR